METIFGDSSSVNKTSPWQPQPTLRGTFGILSTCLVTLGLCVWSAIHLNMPARNEAPWDFICTFSVWKKARTRWPWKLFAWPGQGLRKISWTLLGFLAPELVAFAAYQQYRTAKALTDAVQGKLSPSADPERPSTKENQWTMAHSYFVLMGGYEVAIEVESQNFLPRTKILDEARRRVRLTPAGFQALALRFPHLIPDQSLQKIEDKSKGDAITKALVCFQSAWFCAQCLARLTQRVGISLLELNTLGHALCALLIYCLWWRKPLDTKEPEQVFIRDPEAVQFVAVLSAASNFDKPKSEYDRWMKADWRNVRRARILKEALDLGFEKPLRPDYTHRQTFSRMVPSFRTHESLVRSKNVPILHNLDTSGVMFFPVISSGPGSRRWILGLGRATADRRGDEYQDRLFETTGYEYTSFLRDRLLDSCLGEVTDESIECPPGFQRRTFPLHQSDESEGIYLFDYLAQAGDDGGNSAENTKNINSSKDTTKTIVVDMRDEDLRRWGHIFGAKIPEDFHHESPLADRVRNFPRFDGIRKGMAMYIGLATTGFVYGGLHCLAWSAPFATRVETLLWRISSVAIMATFLLLLLFYCWELGPPFWQNFGSAMAPYNEFWEPLADWMEDMIDVLPYPWDDYVGNAVGVPLTIILIIAPKVLLDSVILSAAALYCLARVYLVVECFINLSHLPQSVYLVPTWSQYVPHIS